MSDIIDFGLDDTKIIKTQGIDQFKLSRSGEKAAFSICAFKRFHDVVLAQKTMEKGKPLTEDEKAELFRTIDGKLAEKLGKKPEDLTEVDRLDVKAPRFWVAHTHYREGVGTIRCLSRYEVNEGRHTCVKPEICCNEIGEAEQTVGTVVLRYPVDRDGNVDAELFKLRKMTEIQLLKCSTKKYKKLESTLLDARKHGFPVADVKVEMEGEQKYQKFNFSNGYTATWAQEGVDPALRNWVLDQGLRAQKHIKQILGFEMKKETLIEKLKGELPSGSSEASAAKPALSSTSYDQLLGG